MEGQKLFFCSVYDLASNTLSHIGTLCSGAVRLQKIFMCHFLPFLSLNQLTIYPEVRQQLDATK